MFLFSWMVGLCFWAFYLVAGFVFCVLFLRKFAPNTYDIIINGFKKKEKTWGVFDYYSKSGKGVDKIDIIGILMASLVFWPITAIIVCFLFLFKLLVVKSTIYAIVFFAKKIPVIEIKTKKEEDNVSK